MPTLGNLGGSNVPFVTLGDIGRYIPTMGALAGPVRGSPGGLPLQAREVSPFALTRERVARELQDNPTLARRFDINTTAEVGSNPEARRRYQAATIDRAVQSGRSLAQTITDPGYYPRSTLGGTRGAGLDVDPAIWEGANPANFATGNASFDPRTGRWVGFAGGPQTATSGAGRGMELYGIEGPQGVEYARIMGYLGPSRTAIGPAGPRGEAGDTSALPTGGWETTVGTGTGGVGYVAPGRVARGAATNPAELIPQIGPRTWGDILADVARNFEWKQAPQVKLDLGNPLAEQQPVAFAPIGQGIAPLGQGGFGGYAR